MVIVEHFTEHGGWSDSCRHELDEGTAAAVEQLGLSFVDRPGDSAHYTVARCVKCGEWVSLERSGPSLLDRLETAEGVV